MSVEVKIYLEIKPHQQLNHQHNITLPNDLQYRRHTELAHTEL